VSAGSVADYLLVVATTGKDEKGRNAITPFFVDVKESPVVVKNLELMGIRQSHICEVFLEDVSIPKENIFCRGDRACPPHPDGHLAESAARHRSVQYKARTKGL